MSSSGPPPLREHLISLDPAAVPVEPTPELPNVWAAMFEMPVGDRETATVVAVADGTASLYTTAGFGVIGAGAHEPVRRAATSFLHATEQALAELDPTDAQTAPKFPSRDAAALIALTFTGRRRAEVPLALANDGGLVSMALRAGNELLTQIRLVHEGRTRGQVQT
jgi:hypothetical protein